MHYAGATRSRAGEKGGVDVHHAVEVAVGDREEAEPAVEGDEVNLRLVAEREDAGGELGRGREGFALDGVVWNAGVGGTLQAQEVGLGADDQRDADGEFTGPRQVDEVLERPAGAGDEDGEVDCAAG